MHSLQSLEPGARVLDFASGSGRHAIAAQALGLSVTAVDRDAQALAQIGGAVRCLVADLETDPWPTEMADFDAVVVCNYLFRPRFAEICGLLAPGGVLVYETFARGNEAYGRPGNPDFLLETGELFERCRAAGLFVLAFEDGFVGAGRRARVQRIRALRPPANLERFAIE